MNTSDMIEQIRTARDGGRMDPAAANSIIACLREHAAPMPAELEGGGMKEQHTPGWKNAWERIEELVGEIDSNLWQKNARLIENMAKEMVIQSQVVQINEEIEGMLDK